MVTAFYLHHCSFVPGPSSVSNNIEITTGAAQGLSIVAQAADIVYVRYAHPYWSPGREYCLWVRRWSHNLTDSVSEKSIQGIASASSEFSWCSILNKGSQTVTALFVYRPLAKSGRGRKKCLSVEHSTTCPVTNGFSRKWLYAAVMVDAGVRLTNH